MNEISKKSAVEYIKMFLECEFRIIFNVPLFVIAIKIKERCSICIRKYVFYFM